jgi:hypothetical protein
MPVPGYDWGVTVLRVVVPDETAERLASEGAQRGASAEDVDAEVLTLHAPAGSGDGLGFIALAHAKPGFSVRLDEQRMEAEGFT